MAAVAGPQVAGHTITGHSRPSKVLPFAVDMFPRIYETAGAGPFGIGDVMAPHTTTSVNTIPPPSLSQHSQDFHDSGRHTEALTLSGSMPSLRAKTGWQTINPQLLADLASFPYDNATSSINEHKKHQPWSSTDQDRRTENQDQIVELSAPAKPQPEKRGPGRPRKSRDSVVDERHNSEITDGEATIEEFFGHSSRKRASPEAQRHTKKAKSTTTPDPNDDKKEKFLERNRIAAGKCRAKKKKEHSSLEQRARDASVQNAMLRAYEAALKEEILSLKNMCLQHIDCGCVDVRQSLQKRFAVVMAAPSEACGHSHSLSPDLLDSPSTESTSSATVCDDSYAQPEISLEAYRRLLQG